MPSDSDANPFANGVTQELSIEGPVTDADIVPYRLRHQQAVEACFRDAWRDSRFPFDPSGAHSDLRRIPAEYQCAGGGFWLLAPTDRVIGTVAVRRLPDNIAEVKRLSVLPGYRGLGLGARLLGHAIRQAKEAGFCTVRLDTIRNPGPALHLFEKHGFVEIPRYNDNPDADLFMELALQ